MLHSTNLILLVGQSEFAEFSPRKVSIWSTSTNSVLCSSWPSTNKISIAKINKKRMIIVERNFLNIYTTSDMQILHTIEIGYILSNKFTFSHCDKNNYICYSPNDEGIVKTYDVNYLCFKTSIKAHKSEIQKLIINSKGDMVATCSIKGTLIRIFNIPQGDKLFTFKRGITPARIFSMNFSCESDKIVVSSDKGTLHVFELRELDKE